MKYPDESWIQNSDKAGELGDVDFGGRMDEWMDGWGGGRSEKAGDSKMVVGRQE
jgi:hypothetical protein